MYIGMLIFLSLLFPVAAVYSIFKYKQRMGAGKDILIEVVPDKQGMIFISESFTVNSKNRWCRVRATFKHICTPGQKTRYCYDENVHSYTIVIADVKTKLLYKGKGSLADHFGFSWQMKAPEGTAQTWSYCEALLLEFIPPVPGTYTLEFTARTQEQFKRTGEKEFSELSDFHLFVSESVKPKKGKAAARHHIDMRGHCLPGK